MSAERPIPPPLSDRPTQADGRVHGVIVGCRRDDGRWLLIRRSEHVIAPGKVCFPGGAVDVDEDYANAARREFREEVGVDVTLVEQVWTMVSDIKPLTLFGWLGTLESFDLQPDPAEVAEVLWLTQREAADHVDALPRTGEFVQALTRADRAAR